MSPHLPLLPLPNFVLCSAFQTAITPPPSSYTLYPLPSQWKLFSLYWKHPIPCDHIPIFSVIPILLLRTPACFVAYSQVSVMLFASKVLSSMYSAMYPSHHWLPLPLTSLYSESFHQALHPHIIFTQIPYPASTLYCFHCPPGNYYSQNLHPSPAYSLLSIIVLAFMAPFKLISPLLLSFLSPVKLFPILALSVPHQPLHVQGQPLTMAGRQQNTWKYIIEAYHYC